MFVHASHFERSVLTPDNDSLATQALITATYVNIISHLASNYVNCLLHNRENKLFSHIKDINERFILNVV